MANSSRTVQLRSRLLTGSVVTLLLALLPLLPQASAVDYRLELVSATFVVRPGEPLTFTVSTPQAGDFGEILTNPASVASIELTAPLTSRADVVNIVNGSEFVAQAAVQREGPIFRDVVFSNAPALQIVVPTSTTNRSGFLRTSQEGLRAVRITVTSPQGRIAQATTFVNIAASRSTRPMPVAFVTSVESGPARDATGAPLVSEQSRQQLLRLRDLLFRKPNDVPIGIRIQPDLLDALQRSPNDADRQLFAELADRLPRNDVLIDTYRPADVSSYAAVGERTVFEGLLLRGENVLDALNGSALPNRSVWLSTTAIDARGVEFLRAFGVTNVVMIGDGADAYGQDTSASRPYALRSNDIGLVLALAERRYGALLSQPIGTAYESATALAAEIIAQRNEIAGSPVGSTALATRQVILAAPNGVPDEPLIAVIALRHLRNSPQIELRSVFDLAPTLEGLARIDPPVVSVVDVAAIQAQANEVRSTIEGIRDVVATNAGLVERWLDVIDISTATNLSDNERATYLDAVTRDVSSVRNAVRLPELSFTFGGQESDLRLSLVNSSPYEVAVRLRLASPTGKLTFDPAINDLILAPGAQREVVVTAVARANGLIPVELVLSTPNGTVLDATQVRVRVNAIAGLGRSVSVVFVVLLVLWWVIYLRRNHRKGLAKHHPVLRSQS